MIEQGWRVWADEQRRLVGQNLVDQQLVELGIRVIAMANRDKGVPAKTEQHDNK